VLNVVLSEHGLLVGLQLKELLINMLPMGTDLLCIVLPNIEASEEALRKKVEDALILAGGMVPLEDDGPQEEDGGS
jgi:hypothetical protein